MTAHRNRPEFGKTNSSVFSTKPDDNPGSCVWLLVVSVGSYFVLTAILRVTSHSGSKSDQIICYGALVIFVIVLLLGARQASQERKSRAARQKSWAASCKTALLAIANRQEAASWWDDYANRYHSTRNSLELEMNADQQAVSQNQTTVRVEVSQSVYDQLKASDTARIYYRDESPLTFLLEEEL